MRRLGIAVLAVGALVLCVGCGVSQEKFDELVNRVAQLEAKATALESNVNNFRAEAEQGRRSIEASLNQVNATLTQRIDTADQKAAALAKTLEETRVSLVKMNQEFEKVRLAVEGTRRVLMKNLRNALDIYEKQFTSMKELVELMDKEMQETTAPAPEKK